MSHRGFHPRTGGIQLPLLFALALFLAIAFRAGNGFMEGVIARKAVFAVDAAATTGVYSLQPMEYTPPALEVPLDPPARLALLSQVALANGAYPELFAPIELADIAAGAVSLSLSLRPLDPDMHPYTGGAHGIPAERMGPGRVWTNALGLAIAATGVLPLGVQAGVLPVNDPLPIELVIGDATQPVSFLQWGVSDLTVAPHLVSLGFLPGVPPAGVPPPGLDIGGAVVRLAPVQDMVDTLQAALLGRVVVLPVLAGDLVAGFTRVRILQVHTLAPFRVQLGLAPSAAVRAALGPALPRDLPAPGPGDIEPLGLVLRPWRTGA